MKTKNIFLALIATALSSAMISCDDFLDREPTSELAPETFLQMSHTYKHMLISIIPVSYLETLEILMAFMQMIKVQIIRFPRAHLAIFVRVNGEFLILLVIGLLPISII